MLVYSLDARRVNLRLIKYTAVNIPVIITGSMFFGMSFESLDWVDTSC